MRSVENSNQNKKNKIKLGNFVKGTVLILSLIINNLMAQGDPAKLYNEGTAKGLNGECIAAIDLFSAAIEIQPDFYEARFNRALCYHKRNKNKEAIEDLNVLLKANPENASYLNLRGICRLILGDKRGALTDLNDAISMKNDIPKYYFDRAMAFQAIGDFPSAINDLDICISLDPTMSDAYYKRGVIRYISGLNEAACIDLSKAIDLGNTNAIDIIRVYCK